MIVVQTRRRQIINTDPQRRCYWGVNAKEEAVWTFWEDLEHLRSDEDAEKRMKFWKELNDYAVDARGEGARNEYKIKEESNANLPAIS